MNRIIDTLVFLVLIVSFAMASLKANASVPNIGPDHTQENKVLFEGGRPYCGAYAVYAASRVLGLSPQLKDLIQPKYIGSEDGSSIEAIERAANDIGLHTAAISNASFPVIANAGTPVILHVLSDSATGRYDHWVTLLRSDRNNVYIFDPPTNFATISMGELVERWDGNAVLLSTRPISVGKLAFKGIWPIGIMVLTLVLIARVASSYLHHRMAAMSPLREVAILMCLIVLVGTIANLFSMTGLFNRTDAGRRIIEASAGHLCPHVDLSAVKSAITNGSAVLVDARFPDDFEAGHIPNAVNVPPDSSLNTARVSLRHVLPASPIIVYCTNPSCSYAGIVAGKLIEAGYGNVLLFVGGWREWQHATARADQPQSG